MPKIWTRSSSEICHEYQTDSKKGLSQEVAHQRLNEHGPNTLPKKGKVDWWKILLSQFSSLIVWLLIAASILAYSFGEAIDSIAILSIVILNAILGFFQEYRAEHSLEALQKLSSPTTKVVRDAVMQTISTEELVPGDLVIIESGDHIPADGRLVQVTHLKVQEAALTGESIPVVKTDGIIEEEDLSLGDRKNMGFMGTDVVFGRAFLIVNQTGKDTEIGKIAHELLGKEKRKTPLQNQLDQLGKKLVYICLFIVTVVFGLGILRGTGVIEMLLISLSLAVAAIPEGLPAAVTISLSIGIRKMAEKKALIRRLASVETLGCTSVICSDKTGTLTKNEMTVRAIWVDDQVIEVTGSGYAPFGDFRTDDHTIEPKENKSLTWAMKCAALCNNANVHEKNGEWVLSGDPTEGALLAVSGKADLKKEELEKEYPLVDELPFDSDRKMMSMLRNSTLFTKGAPDVVLENSTHFLFQGEARPLDDVERNKIMEANRFLASKGLRILAVATRGNTQEPYEEKLTFVGLIGMMDPPREEVMQALDKCRDAGIRAVMVTGDHKETAIAIGNELSMIPEGAKVIDGKQLDQMDDLSFEKEIENIAIFSRITAQHKLRIVNAFKKKGIITAMTGDGVNDAPAVHAADIGISMGITGTDVTKESSDMVILDDNFASIVGAVEQGRGIYDNIVKFVSYLLSSNIAEILVIFLSMLIGFKGPDGESFVALLPVQLLWMNLVTDGFPAIALAMDPVDKRVMKKRPRSPNEGILTKRFTSLLLSISSLVTIGALMACFYGLKISVAHAQTMTFTTLIVLELVRVQMIRKHYRLTLFSNRYLVIALASSFLLQLGVVYIPLLQPIFGTVSLGWLEWAFIIGISFGTWWGGLFITKLFYRDL